jgi:hypothetical protein
MLLAMRSLWWVITFLFWIIVCAAFGVTLLVVPPVWWIVRAVARLGNGVRNIRSSRAGSIAAISDGTAGELCATSHTAAVLPRSRNLRQASERGPICVRTTDVLRPG